MKKTAVLILFLLLSCREYRAMISEETKNIKDVKMFFSDDKKDIFKIGVNGVEHSMLFDTGAAETIIYNTKFAVDNNKKIRNRTVYGFDKKVKINAYNYSVDSLKSDAFIIKHKYLYVTDASRDICSTKLAFDGILGNFIDSDYLLELNYEEGFIRFVDDIPKEDYIPIKAKFSSYTGKFTLCLTVNGKVDDFLFDTGNKTITLLNKDIFSDVGQKFYTIKSINLAVGNVLVTSQIDIYQGLFSINDQLKFETPVGIDKSSSRSVLSKNFIQKFNWYIDRKNSKVDCRPIDIDQLSRKKEMQTKKRLQAAVIDGNLLVSFVNHESQYELGNKILSVNGEKVTPENICNLQNLLNSTDWSILKIEVTPNKISYDKASHSDSSDVITNNK